MDQESFDRLARAMGALGTRRGALGALLGAGIAGAAGAAEAARKDRGKKRKSREKGRAQVAAQAADCSSPGPSSNMNGCPFQGRDFSGDDLSGSSMVGTNFNNSELVGTNLSSSNMRGASFRGADLCGADLSSSVLRNADFRGFNPLNGGRVTNLTLADLSSSGGCGTILTNQFTIICGTIWCDGTVRNDDCSGGPASDFCCPACGSGVACVDNECVLPCTGDCAAEQCCSGDACVSSGWDHCGADGEICETCANGEVCAGGAACEACADQTGGTSCDGFGDNPEANCSAGPRVCACAERADGSGSVCWGGIRGCRIDSPCVTDDDCAVLDLGPAYCVKRGTCDTGDCGGETICVGVCDVAAARAARRADPPPGIKVEFAD